MANTTVTRERLTELAASFKEKRIGVVGDVMLDVFTYGASYRMSPEAPAPVVLVESENAMPGGAANVAHNTKALGAMTDLIGRVGKDESGARLKQLSEAKGVSVHGVREVALPFPTIEKRRIVSS